MGAFLRTAHVAGLTSEPGCWDGSLFEATLRAERQVGPHSQVLTLVGRLQNGLVMRCGAIVVTVDDEIIDHVRTKFEGGLRSIAQRHLLVPPPLRVRIVILRQVRLSLMVRELAHRFTGDDLTAGLRLDRLKDAVLMFLAAGGVQAR